MKRSVISPTMSTSEVSTSANDVGTSEGGGVTSFMFWDDCVKVVTDEANTYPGIVMHNCYESCTPAPYHVYQSFIP